MKLIFLHYFGGSPASWNQVLPLLSVDFDCQTLDLKTKGLWQFLSKNESLCVAVAEELWDLSEEFWLVGHSMGGKFALDIAALQPPNLRGLVLLAPSPPTPEPIPDKERKRLLETHGTREAARETICGVTHRELASAILEQEIGSNLATPKRLWNSWLLHGSKEDISHRIPNIAVPVVVAAGAQDKGMTPELMEREVVGRIAGARLEIVPDCGHLLPLEAPEVVADFISSTVKG